MHKGQDTIRMVTNYVYKHLAGAGYNMCQAPRGRGLQHVLTPSNKPHRQSPGKNVVPVV